MAFNLARGAISKCFEKIRVLRLVKQQQDGNVPSRRHILGSKIFKEQLLEKFGKKIFFSKKKFLIFFFEKKVFFRSHNAEKLKKRPFRLIQRFLQTENWKMNKYER